MLSKVSHTDIIVYNWYSLIFGSLRGQQQRHLNTLKSPCIEKDFSIKLDQTKVMVFNTTHGWVTRSESEFLLGEATYTRS